MSREIETAIGLSDWKEARRLIRAALRRQPDSHWLLTRLSATFYEERNYAQALSVGLDACEVAPNCPLVLWDLAGTFDMLDRHADAVKLYRRLIKRGVEEIAVGDCGEGRAWARGLVADCWYRIAGCESKRGQRVRAVQSYEQHLKMRGPGCRSLYDIELVRREMSALSGQPQLRVGGVTSK